MQHSMQPAMQPQNWQQQQHQAQPVVLYPPQQPVPQQQQWQNYQQQQQYAQEQPSLYQQAPAEQGQSQYVGWPIEQAMPAAMPMPEQHPEVTAQPAQQQQHAQQQNVPGPTPPGLLSKLMAGVYYLGGMFLGITQAAQQMTATGVLTTWGVDRNAGTTDDADSALGKTALSYKRAFWVFEIIAFEPCMQIHDPLEQSGRQLLVSFDLRPTGGLIPLPRRAAVMCIKRTPKEEMGLYLEKRPSLGDNSLVKMEQRLSKEKTIDRTVLRTLGGEPEEMHAMAARFHEPSNEQGAAAMPRIHQHLSIGVLPVLKEEEELRHGLQDTATETDQSPRATPIGGRPQHSHGIGAKHKGTAGIPLMKDGQQMWQALEYHKQGLSQIGALNPNHPNHIQLILVHQAMQQMTLGGPLPAVGLDGLPVSSYLTKPTNAPSAFLDEDGLLAYTPDPLKVEKERPCRRFDQDRDATRTFMQWPIVEGTATNAEVARTYRLDIELNRLELLVHPDMSHEDLLAAKLLAAFKEFKRREAAGLAAFYANRLAAQEDALLSARERLFELSEMAARAVSVPAALSASMARGLTTHQVPDASQGAIQGQHMSPELRAAFEDTCRQEREVAETRQLKEEEELLAVKAVEAMQKLYAQILAERASQGFWRTNLELATQQQPPEELQWAMGAGVPRDTLDAMLLVADSEAISGMPPPPHDFPPPPDMQDMPPDGFKPRRLECMCASHKALLQQLTNRLDELKGRPSADPQDPVICQLEDQIQALGLAPRRLSPCTPDERSMAHAAAMQRIAAGDVGVPRIPKLMPILTVLPNQGRQLPPDQAKSGQQLAADVAGKKKGPGPRPQGPKNRYFIKLYVNNHYVDCSQPLMIGEDFAGQFKDVFSVQMVRWPESITMGICEKGSVRDTLLATVYMGVPGLAGSAHVDPRPMPYQFTSQVPQRARDASDMCAPAGDARWDGGVRDTTIIGQAVQVYPAGIVYARCGWVPQDAAPGARIDTVKTYENPLADAEWGQAVMPPVPRVTVDRLLRRAAERIGCQANRQVVRKWLNQHVVDPNDPRNAPLVELLKANEATNGAMGDLFRLDVFPDVAIEEGRTQNKRCTFLSRRWAAGMYRDPERSILKGLRHVKIPAVLMTRDVEDLEHLYLDALAMIELVPGGTAPDIARAMLARQERATRMQIGPELTKAIEDRETGIKMYALRMRAAANRIAGGKQACRKYKTDDVVNDVPLPEFKFDMSTLARAVAPRRPLKRERKVIKSLQTSVPPETELVVTVRRASNLPHRRSAADTKATPGAKQQARGRAQKDVDSNVDQTNSRDGPDGTSQIFVEVRFRGRSCRTATCAGDFPTFNELMSLPVFGGSEEPSSQALYENNDLITINVFDEIINDRTNEPRVLKTNPEDAVSDPVRYPERERRFLGCVRIPLSSVYQVQVLEGTFKLETPPVVLGYSQRTQRPPAVTMTLSLKPRLAPPTELQDHLLSGELEDVTQHARTWVADCLQMHQCRDRVIKALATDPEGTSLLVTRYVAPTRLPPSIVDAITTSPTDLHTVSHTEAVMLKAARFVSLVPYLEDSSVHKRRVDVWSSNAEALSLAAGDAEEHAHLLAGYFLEIGQQAFVVMGASTFGARSYFVLTTGKPEFGRAGTTDPELFNWNELHLRLWNPLSGSVCSVKDVTGDMREVGAVYHHSNVWANTQNCGAPWDMNWRLNDTRYWRPFFGQQLHARELGTIQVPPVYKDLSPLFYEQLETRMEEAARDALQKARALGAFVTKPDNKVSRVLKSLLREMPAALAAINASSLAASLALADVAPSGENVQPLMSGLADRHKVISALQESHHERVCRETRGEWLHGHILAVPFSDKYTEAVTEAVLNTGLHRVADSRAKYSVAAMIERTGAAYCCCCWIYIAVTR